MKLKFNSIKQHGPGQPSSTQNMLLFDEDTNEGERIKFDNLASVILDRIKTKVFDFSDGSSETIINEIDIIRDDIHASAEIYYGTRQYWNSRPELIARRSVFYIYEDYQQKEESGQIVYIPGLKVGDGRTYLIDMPFISSSEEVVQMLNDHINDNISHVTLQDRNFWNNKCSISGVQNQNVIFTTL